LELAGNSLGTVGRGWTGRRAKKGTCPSSGAGRAEAEAPFWKLGLRPTLFSSRLSLTLLARVSSSETRIDFHYYRHGVFVIAFGSKESKSANGRAREAN